MGLSYLRAHASCGLIAQRAGSIRRVIRRGSIFICGLCRTQHREQAVALACVNDCWLVFLQLPPVVVKRRALRRVFRCRFCARDHLAYKNAEACARDCRLRQKQQHAADMASFDLSLLPDRPRRQAKPKMTLVQVRPTSRIQGKTPKGPESVTDTGPIHADAVTTAAAPSPTSAAPTPAAPAAAATAAPKDDVAADANPKLPKNSGKFYRDNAKYACSSCNKRFFTRLEVEQCFDSHTPG